MRKYILTIKRFAFALARVRLSRATWIASALCLLVVFGFIQAPARLAAFANNSGRVYLDGLSGTVWDGSAQLATARIRGQWLSLGQANWHVHKLYLLLGTFKLTLQSRHPNIEGDVILTARGNQMHVETGQGLVDAAVVTPWLPKWMRVLGQLDVRINHFIYTNGIQQLDSEIFWSEAQLSVLGKQYHLGNLILNTSKDESSIRIGVSNAEDAPLQLSGTVNYYGDQIGLDIMATPSATTHKDMVKALRTLAGKPNDQGVYHLEFSQKL